MEGMAPTPSMSRQPMWDGSLEKPKLETKRSEKSAGRSRSHLSSVDRGYHESISDPYAGHKPTDHEEGVICGEPHKKGSTEENCTGKHNSVAAANPAGQNGFGGERPGISQVSLQPWERKTEYERRRKRVWNTESVAQMSRTWLCRGERWRN
ncbi:S-adenosyl-L-methionine-dependentmethyltransferases superfamily protein [Striga asiatica]|uniref:S-adenosyl-L-methionine-dependentmethyltransferases superfamily protein n=1 Tax=Striga asiatica TaxID=4170 RepID=A0A5A7P8S3_STRAF|nr:S-adenosyl-L-methionine-dependentmethyltransferases superfamily protein [Striga asiatica]